MANSAQTSSPLSSHDQNSRLARGFSLATVLVDELELFPGNPRRSDVDAIKQSLEANGQYQPLVVDRRTMRVLVGNHRLIAARELGWKTIAVVFIDVDEQRGRKIALADNRTSDRAEYDSQALAELLSQLEDDFEGTGYTQSDLDALLDELSDPLVFEDDIPSVPAEPRSVPGEIYRLGRHRLACGDARDEAVLARLMGAEQAIAMWTDAPYAVRYEGKTPARLRIEGDSPDGFDVLLHSAFAAADHHLSPGAALYVCHPSGAASVSFIEAFRAQGWLIRQGLVWAKNSLVLSRADYHYQHEQLLYGFKPGPGRLGRGGNRWFGGNRQSTVLEIDRPSASREHPTAKPVELIEIALRNSTRRRELVLDPFAGSGSTLVACERLGRAARLVEIEPRYVDVAIERFERLTGERAVREGGD